METERKSSRDVEHLDLETLLRRPSLRANLPRRVSQAPVPTEGTTCGLGCVRGDWLQSFANRKSYIFVYGVLGSFYGSYYAYFYGSITTLEKRYSFSSWTLGMVATVSEILQIFLSLILYVSVRKLHKPRWIGLGVCLVVVSTVISSLPHFLYDVEPCAEECTQQNVPLLLLILAQILHGIGSSLYFTLGRMYNDENIQKHQAPALLSLLSILKILGPAFGYWLSSICLKIFVSPELTPDAKEEDGNWTGAWWLGNLIIGFLLSIPGVMLMLFPAALPKAALRRLYSEAIETTSRTENQEKPTILQSFFRNSTYKCNNFASILNICGFVPYFIFLPKYVEIQYRLSTSSANLIIGSVTLISSACGIVIASSIIARYRPPAAALVCWKLFVNILSIGSLISFVYLGCTGNDEQTKATATWYMTHRPNTTYYPACDEDKMKDYNDTQAAPICDFNTCPVDCYFNFVIFAIVTSSISFIFATGYTSNYWLETKYAEKPNKSTSLNIGMLLLSFITFVPVQIIFGHILDNSCLLWNKICNQTGNCWLYDTEKLRNHMNLTAVGFATIGIIYDLGVLYSIKDIELFDDDSYIEESDEC